MACNTRHVLGDEDVQAPSTVVIGWTPGGSGDGGTGQAYRLARAHGFPVVDLAMGGRFDAGTPARVRRNVDQARAGAPAAVSA